MATGVSTFKEEKSGEEHPTCMQAFSSAGPERVAAGAPPSAPRAPAADPHQQRNLGEGSCSVKLANPPLHTLLTVSKISQRSLFLHADLRFQMQVYSHVFNQYVDKASQEENHGQDGGPLDNHLLVITQHLKHDFDTHTQKKPHKSHRNM